MAKIDLKILVFDFLIKAQVSAMYFIYKKTNLLPKKIEVNEFDFWLMGNIYMIPYIKISL